MSGACVNCGSETAVSNLEAALAYAGAAVVAVIAGIAATEVTAGVSLLCASNGQICQKTAEIAGNIASEGGGVPPSASMAAAEGIRGANEINAADGFFNCVSCAIAGDATAAGRAAQAIGDKFGTGTLSQVIEYAKSTGATKMLQIGSPAEAAAIMRMKPQQTGIIVLLGIDGKPGHAFNVIKNAGSVLLQDFQPRQANISSDWAEFSKAYLIPTN
jgi:hypothetical protein